MDTGRRVGAPKGRRDRKIKGGKAKKFDSVSLRSKEEMVHQSEIICRAVLRM